MKKVKYLIVGAGISGLTFANYCKGDYLVIEKENEVGGYCRTFKRKDYIWDYAGHFFHFKTDEFKKKFLDKMNSDDIIYNEKCTKILYKDKFIDFPFQTNIHELEKEEFIDCLYDLFTKEEKENYNDFLDMLYGKFGKSIVEKFLRPYNEKLYSTDLSSLDVDAMGRFFPYADKEAIIKNMKNNKYNSYNGSFLYPKNGAESIIRVLEKKIDSKKILLNTFAEKIDLSKKEVTLSSGEQIEYDNLINTIPLNNFLELIGGYNYLVNELSYNKVLILNMGFDKQSPKFKKEHWIYVPSKDYNFYRVGFYNNILNTDKLSIYVEIGYGKNNKITSEEITKQVDLTMKNLKKVCVIDENMKLVDYEAIVMDPAYVHINSETNKKIDELKKELKKKNVYTIGRYGAWIYNSMEDSMLAAKNLAQNLLEEKQ